MNSVSSTTDGVMELQSKQVITIFNGRTDIKFPKQDIILPNYYISSILLTMNYFCINILYLLTESFLLCFEKLNQMAL